MEARGLLPEFPSLEKSAAVWDPARSNIKQFGQGSQAAISPAMIICPTSSDCKRDRLESGSTPGRFMLRDEDDSNPSETLSNSRRRAGRRRCRKILLEHDQQPHARFP